jgi:hypothetical protein
MIAFEVMVGLRVFGRIDARLYSAWAALEGREIDPK